MRFCLIHSDHYDVTFVRGEGRFRAADIRQVNDTSAKSALFARGAPVLNDMRFVNFDVDTSEIMAMRLAAPHLPPGKPDRRIAFVAGSELAYGMLRMLATLREAQGRVSRVFRGFGPAAVWIARPELGDVLPEDIDRLLGAHVPGGGDPDDGFRIFVHAH